MVTGKIEPCISIKDFQKLFEERMIVSKEFQRICLLQMSKSFYIPLICTHRPCITDYRINPEVNEEHFTIRM